VAIERHVIELTARDTVTPTLQKIATQAQRTGQQAEQAAQKASRSSQDWGRAASALGTSLGGLTLVATKLANDAEVSQQRLRSSIEATGASYEDYADQIDKAAKSALQLAFDDEEAIDALSQLTQATGDTSRALEDLSLVQDIARARGIDLAAAAKIVIAAETGRVGSLARLGIAIDANATREEALAALQSKFAGQAEAYAETNAATWQRVQNSIENALEGAGGALVDYQALILGVSTAGAALGPLATAFGNVAKSAKLASAAGSAMNLAMGPAGMIGIAGLAAVALYKWSQSADDSALSAAEAQVSIANLNRSIAELGQAGASPEVLQSLASIADEYARADERTRAYSLTLEGVGNQIKRLQSEKSGGEGLTGLSLERLDAIDAEIAALREREAQLNQNILTETEYNKLQADSIDLMTNLSTLNKDVVIARFEELWQEWETGIITSDQLAWNINWLKENSATYGLTLEQIANQQKTNAEGMGLTAEEAAKLAANMKAVAEQNTSAREASVALNNDLITLAGTLQRDFAGAAGSAYDQVVGFTQGMVDAIGTSAEWARSLEDHLHGQNAFNDITRDGTLDAEDYNEVTRERAEIIDSLARATAAANEIQVKQIDIVSEGADATADYLERISKLPEAEQALALAWADQDLAGRALEIAGLSEQFSTMGATQQQAFATMVTSAAEADPQLARILESMELIEKQADGTYELKVPSDQAKSDTDRLIDAINQLTNAINGVPNISVEATLHTQGFWDAYLALPDSKTINVYTRSGDYGPTPGAALGGMIPWEGDTAAMGRMIRGRTTLVGENGPELVNLPGGSTVIPNHASRYMSPKDGHSFVIQNMTVIANDPQSFMTQMRDYVSTMERR
jgi:hypothetical protein